jgi:hypothetical protein
MARWYQMKTPLMFAAGLSAGLLLGVAMVVGVVIGMNGRSPGETSLSDRFLAEVPLHATGADGGKSIAMATGVIDEGTEGVFVLDFLTGDLQCWVINPRVGQFTNLFKTNVIGDLGIEQGKTPDYVMTAGIADFRGPASMSFGRSIVYVGDGNTGNVACYAVPWSRAAATSAAVQTGPLQRVAVGKARVVAIQE